MNFDTRTILDILSLDFELKNNIVQIIDEEQLFSENIGTFNSESFVISITPLLKDSFKSYLKFGLKNIDMLILKSTIDISNIDYKIVIEKLTEY